MTRGARRMSLLAMALVALAACQPHSSDDEAFGKRVRAYLLSHPEVLREVAQRLDAKMAAQADTDQRRAESQLPALRQSIERDPRDFVANPGGAITVTEFYDYRCPHCANAAPKVLALIHANPDIRFVFKDTPIFGPTSEHAARAALAVRRAGGDSLGLYQSFMADHALDDAAIDRISRRMGAREGALKPTPETTAQLAQTAALFTKLNLEGTPAFIVGDQIILGEDMSAVNQAIARARARKA